MLLATILPRAQLPTLALVLHLTCPAMPPTHYFSPLPTSAGLPGAAVPDNGAALTKLFADGGPGTTVFLRPSALYVLLTTVDLSHAHTTLATEGYPAFESGLQAVLETRGEKEAGAVAMFNKSGTALKRVHVRGCRGWGRTKPSEEEAERLRREEGAMGWVEGGGALVWAGGPEAERQVIEGCRLEDPRGWTAVHITDWANHCKLINNIVGPCGQQGEPRLLSSPLATTLISNHSLFAPRSWRRPLGRRTLDRRAQHHPIGQHHHRRDRRDGRPVLRARLGHHQ